METGTIDQELSIFANFLLESPDESRSEIAKLQKDLRTGTVGFVIGRYFKASTPDG